MLSKSNTPKKVTFDEATIKRNPTKKMTREDINQRLKRDSRRKGSKVGNKFLKPPLLFCVVVDFHRE